ncbi:hypothetical protein HHL17_23630 [Chitinophaga sp. G-6-1-13]|uniref:Uncharacterized protein n=1 Tax=Chitinophaga fulva TaxID=2728842 RepID=A0A848GRS1_9BACT|nr:hypothetical protein [Chitinophaga fulva]NML40211.1 hypothetical protein [Chitinophaga fulva]
MIKRLFLFLLLVTCGIQVYAQTSGRPVRRPSDPDRLPVYIVDSVQVTQADLAEINPNDIVSMWMRKKDQIGRGNTDTIFMETKQFVRNRYWLIFSQNAAYRKVVPAPGEDGDVLYILDGNALGENPEKALAAVNMSNFDIIGVIDKSLFTQNHNPTGKKYGVVITLKKKK